jgi:hypothetical protein
MAVGVNEALPFRDCVADHELAIDAIGLLAVGLETCAEQKMPTAPDRGTPCA